MVIIGAKVILSLVSVFARTSVFLRLAHIIIKAPLG